MNNMHQVFANGKAFIPSITAGYPSLEVTEELVLAMAEAGADLIELGIPFSDPVAGGETVQAANERALAAGTTTDKIFAMVQRLRDKRCQVPIALMTYMNPIFTYGAERFMRECQESGVGAVIVPDVPFEERHELAPYCSKYGVNLVSMVAPTSRQRISMIAQEAQGFIYCVSSLGAAGAGDEVKTDLNSMIDLVKEVQNIPCAVGFDISSPEQAAHIAEHADGIIAGSSIMQIAAEHGDNCVSYIADYVRAMKEVL